MAIKNGEEYIESLRKVRFTAYVDGEKIGPDDLVDHPLVRPSIDTVAFTYDLCADSDCAENLTVPSHLTGEKISIFTHIAQSTEDLERKVRALRLIQQKIGNICIMRCSSLDGLASPYSVTYDMDQELGTEYHKRFKKFLKRVQKDDLYVTLAVTDPKGDRRLRPHEQKDPDMYLRLVDKNSNGIVVRGAKFHQSGTLASHVKIVTPTRVLTSEDKDYAVMFSVPSDAQGLIQILDRQPIDHFIEGKSIEKELCKYSSHAGMVIFQDVFIPWEDVYMCGEYQFTGSLISRFGHYHRCTYGGCFPGQSDVIIGAAAALAESHGVEKDPIIQDKLLEMTYLSEVMFSCGISCAHLGFKSPSGVYFPNPILSNVLKLNIAKAPYEIARLAEDIAGGNIITIPPESNLKHSELKDLMDKYMKGADGTDTEDRIRLLIYLNLTLLGGERGSLSGVFGSTCGAAGPYQAAKVHLKNMIDIEEKKKFARLASGILK